MSNPSSTGPKANPPAPAASASASSKPSVGQYSVGPIPAFNYAAAAKKSKPSPAAVSGQDATGVLNGSTGGSSPSVSAASAMASAGQGSQPTSPVQGHQKKPSAQVQVEAGVRVPPSRVDAIRGAAESDVAFGTANDKNATLSSSPAAPPAFNHGSPKTFGTLPAGTPSSSAAAPAAAKKALDIHSFFTSSGSSPASSSAVPPSASPVPVPSSSERRSLATYDPQASRSPQPSSSPLHHGLGGAATAAFIPRTGNQIPPPFAGQHQPGAQAFSPPSAFYPGPGGVQPGAAPFVPKGPSPQNIPNGTNMPTYGGPGAPSSAGSRPGSFVGSPVLGGGIPRPPPQQQRPSFGGPTSPRMQPTQLGQQPMMYSQGYVRVAPIPPLSPPCLTLSHPQPQNAYPGYPNYNPYAPYPGAFIQPGAGGPPPPLNNSGTSTPSNGVHTPKPPVPVPASPSLATHALAPSTPSTASFSTYSPQAQNASLPRGPNPSAPLFTPGTPLRVNVPEFKMNLGASEFTPSKRGSAAIKIVNPKDRAPESKPKEEAPKTEAEPVKPEEKAAEAAPAPAAAESKSAPVEEKKEDAEAAARKAEEDAAAEQAKLDGDAAEAKAKAVEVTKAKAEDAAAAAPSSKPVVVEDLKREETATPDVSTPSTPGEEVAGLHVKSSQADAVRAEEAALLADEKAATESRDPAEALAEAREALNATSTAPSASVPPTPTTSTLPSFLPAKPVSEPPRRPSAVDATAADATASTSTAPSSAQIAAARPISDLSSVSYPENVKAPHAELNIGADSGKYRYDREFLLQFLHVCTAKPDSLPNLADIGMVDDGAAPRGASSFGSRRGLMGPPAAPSRQGSSMGAFGRSASLGGVGGGFGGMGNFGQGGLSGTTSEQRFQASLARSQSGAFGGQRGSMSRTTSQSSMGGAFGGRTKSDRGSKRRGDKKDGNERDESRKPGQHVAGDGFENATLAPRSETGWAPSVLVGGAAKDVDMSSPEMVQRKVKALLNKLTLERFDSISDQILEWANKSVDETDGRILRQVIALIFEKATDEATWSEMYARLCRKLMERVSPEVRDETVKTADGTPVAGGALFRKYLLNRCQEDYEQGWKNKEAAAAAAKSKEADDKAKQEANDAAKKEAEDSGQEPSKEAELLSDEYYAAQKAKRRGLGLVRFIGELYRLSMLTERIMHECIKKLLANTDSPEEEDVESLCRLLTTVGKGLDNAKAKQHMDVYFSRMNTIANSPKVSSRIRFMILDVVDLRSAKWQSKTAAAGPKTISEIHADAQKAAEESARRVASSGGKLPRLGDQLSRPNSRRGQTRGESLVPQTGADGWTTQPQRPAKAGDLSGFGRIRDTSAGISLGPTGAFANRNRKQKEEAARPATPSNPFALLEGGADGSEPPASTASQRPRLNLQPRTKPIEGEDKEEEEKKDEEDEDDGAIDPNASSMTREEAERRAKNSVDEFYEIKNLSEGVASVEALPKEYRSLLITRITEAALTKKADAVNLTRDLFKQIVAKEVISHDQIVAAFEPVMKTIVDTAIDAPGAYGFAATLMIGAGVTKEETEELKTKMESEEGEEEVAFGIESWDRAYAKVAEASA
ncbi:hypothetical protein JCM6882_004585 [Rhodosporidiobolus microsporus]